MKPKVLLLVIILLTIVLLVMGQEQELKYRVDVEVKLLPVFAQDQEGNPVYDLERDELELTVNGKKQPIAQFTKYAIHYDQTNSRTMNLDLPAVGQAKPPKRLLFIIIDRAFNSLDGLRRSKTIAAQLINDSGPNERFVLLDNHPGSGLHYLAGPETDKKKLLAAIQSLSPVTQKWEKDFFKTNRGLPGVSEEPNTTYDAGFGNLWKLKKSMEKQRYRHNIRRFSNVLTRFKFALQTVTCPKITYIISEGPARVALSTEYNGKVKITAGEIEEEPAFYRTYLFNYFKDIAKAVNEGGSVLHTINPQKLGESIDENLTGEMGLSYLAKEGGGRYFAGSKLEQVITNIKRATAAYYELAIAIKGDTAERMKLELRCKRPGVEVYSPGYAEKDIPYHKMKELQKKLFAFDAMNNGDWSRIAGSVSALDLKNLSNKKSGDIRSYTFEATIPQALIGKKADLFFIQYNPDTHKVQMKLKRQTLKHHFESSITGQKEEKLNLVVIEPETTTCLVARIR